MTLRACWATTLKVPYEALEPRAPRQRGYKVQAQRVSPAFADDAVCAQQRHGAQPRQVQQRGRQLRRVEHAFRHLEARHAGERRACRRRVGGRAGQLEDAQHLQAQLQAVALLEFNLVPRLQGDLAGVGEQLEGRGPALLRGGAGSALLVSALRPPPGSRSQHPVAK
jgi:hypothetical protein